MEEFEIAASALETSELRWELQLRAGQFRQSLLDIWTDAVGEAIECALALMGVIVND